MPLIKACRMTYRGKPVEEMSREELIIALEEQHEAHQAVVQQHWKERDFLVRTRAPTMWGRKPDGLTIVGVAVITLLLATGVLVLVAFVRSVGG